MDPERLHELADRVRGVLTEFGIELEGFTLGVTVTYEYYQSVKENFPNRHSADRIVGTAKQDWSIDLMYSLHRLITKDAEQRKKE